MTRVFADLLGVGVGVFTIFLFYETFWEIKNVKRSLLVLFVSLAIISNTAINNISPNSIFLLIASLLTSFLLSLLFISSITSKVLLSIAISAISIIIELLISVLMVQIMGIQVEQVQDSTLVYALGLLISQLVPLLIVCIIRIFFKRKKQEISRQSNLLIAFFPLQAIFLCLIVYGPIAGINALHSAAMGIIAVVVSLLLVFIAIIMINRQQITVAYKKQLEVAHSRLEMQTEHDHKLYQAQREFSSIRHEISNNLIAISGLLKDNMVDKAFERIQSIFEGVVKESEIPNTGFPPIDAVLSAKINRATELGIKIAYKVLIVGKLIVDYFDIAIIVASALDNAIEGVDRSEVSDKLISLNVADVSDYIVVQVENYTSGPIDKDFRTAKPDKSSHGFGLAHMKSVAKKYDGVVEPGYNPASGKFTLRVLLRNKSA